MPTGLAPVIPLDRSGKKARSWRVANREIRGIAGGRWFARSWVGEKDSDTKETDILVPISQSPSKGGDESISISISTPGPHGLSKMRGLVAVGPAIAADPPITSLKAENSDT